MAEMNFTVPDGMERTKCACNTCVACCKAMPGCLIPGDLERIQAHVGRPDGEFVLEHFRASDGAKVLKEVGGQLYQISVPTIVPAQKEDGSCVFLDENDHCSIHEVAPFGCAYHDTHMSAEEADPRSQFCVSTQIQSHQNGTPYSQWVAMLAELGLSAPSLEERRANLEKAINGSKSSQD